MNCHPKRKGPQTYLSLGVVSRRICGCSSALVHEEQPDSPSCVTPAMNAKIPQHPHPHHTVIPTAVEGSAAAFRACSCGAKHRSAESKNPHPHLPFPAKTLGAPFIRGFIANGWESKTLNLLVHKGILESMATPCERARLQSCRKAPKKTLGFSPCRNTLTTRQL